MSYVFMADPAATANDLHAAVDPSHTGLGVVFDRDNIDEDPLRMFKNTALRIDPNRAAPVFLHDLKAEIDIFGLRMHDGDDFYRFSREALHERLECDRALPHPRHAVAEHTRDTQPDR